MGIGVHLGITFEWFSITSGAELMIDSGWCCSCWLLLRRMAPGWSGADIDGQSMMSKPIGKYGNILTHGLRATVLIDHMLDHGRYSEAA